jgi:hypothetical protein
VRIGALHTDVSGRRTQTRQGLHASQTHGTGAGRLEGWYASREGVASPTDDVDVSLAWKVGVLSVSVLAFVLTLLALR